MENLKFITELILATVASGGASILAVRMTLTKHEVELRHLQEQFRLAQLRMERLEARFEKFFEETLRRSGGERSRGEQ
jgi:hypothetical protein